MSNVHSITGAGVKKYGGLQYLLYPVDIDVPFSCRLDGGIGVDPAAQQKPGVPFSLFFLVVRFEHRAKDPQTG